MRDLQHQGLIAGKLRAFQWASLSILRDAIISCDSLGLDFDTVFSNTNTSYSPDDFGRSSGKTGADVERILAFHAIGRKDPVEYVDDWDTVLKHAIETEKRHEAVL